MERRENKDRLRRVAVRMGLASLTGVALALPLGRATAQVLVPAGGGSVTLTEQGIRFEGQTTGDYSLMNLAGRDRRRRLCLGYGDPEPDHVLVLAEAVPRLVLTVESEGDTTLLVDGPRGIDCNDNYRRNNRNAQIRDGRWPAGTYRIWVGAFERGDRIDYRLTVAEPKSK